MAKSIPVRVAGSKKGSVSSGATLQTGLAGRDFFLPFFHYLTIPKNTQPGSYTSYVLSLPISEVFRVWCEFPKGCAGLVGLQLYRGTEQIFPLPAGVWLRSDGYTLSFAFSHLVDKEPFEIEIRGYNTDDTYSHTLWVGLELRGLPSEISPQMQSLIDVLKG